jgi:TP901 family phage tail tape measure protein
LTRICFSISSATAATIPTSWSFDYEIQSTGMSESVIRELVVRFKGDTVEFERAMESALGGLKGFASEAVAAGGAIGAGLAAGAAAIAGIGIAAIAAGQDVNQAWREIEVRTGATGDVLKGLQADFAAVFANVPESAKGVGDTIAQLSQRLGLAGEALRELSEKEIELAHITGAQLGPQVQATSKLFEQWKSSIKDPSDALEFLFAVSQKTGITVTQLSDELARAGPVMRDFGISFEQGAAMLAQLDKEGLDSGKVIAGMSIAFRALVKQTGGDVLGAFDQLIDRMKNAGSAADANTLAIQYFGKGAATMGEAVRSGKLDVDGLLKSLETSGPGIKKTAEDVRTVGESFEQLKNKVEGLLAPLGQDLIAAMDGAVQGLSKFVDAYESDWGGLKTAIDADIKDIASFYHDHKAEIDALAQAVGVALGVAVKFWAEGAKEILDSISAITLAMRVATGDWSAAWQQINDISAREQEKNKAAAAAFVQWNLDKFGSYGREVSAVLSASWDAISRLFTAAWDSLKTQTENAWQAIKQAIIEPIQETLDWLQSKVRDFQAAFSAITEAARAGLIVHSPPAAAVWLAQIGESAGAAAEAAKKAAPQFDAGFSAVSSSAAKNIPAVTGQFQGLGASIVKVLEDLGVKVPKIFDDIFGSISKSRGAGSAKASAAKTGTELGDELVDAFGAALKGVQGVAAAAKQGGVFGGIEGALSGAMAGAEIGSLFPGIGTAVGAVVGGALGLIGGLFGKSALQKAQEAAALQQALDAVKESQQQVLQAVEQTKQSWIKTLDDARALLESIQFYTKVPKISFQQFFADVNKLFAQVVDLAKAWKLDATADIKAAADNLLAGVQLVAALPAALDGISKYLGTPDESFAQFFAAANNFFTKLDDWFATIQKSTARMVSKWSGLLSPGADLVKSLIEGLTGMTAIKDLPTDDQFALIGRAIDIIISSIGAIADKVDKSLLKAVAFFADKAQSALTLWKDATDAIRATVDVPTVSKSDADNVVTSIRTFLDALIAGLQDMATDQLVRVTAIAESITPIAAALKAWADATAAIRGYTAIAAETWQLVLDDFKKGLQLLSVLLEQATEFDDLAGKVDDKLESGAAKLAKGVAAMAGAVKSTADVLQAAFGQIQGGATPGTVVGGQSFDYGSALVGSFGGSGAGSFGPRPGGAPGGGGIYFAPGSIVVQGSLIHQSTLQDAVVAALVDAQRRGRLAA